MLPPLAMLRKQLEEMIACQAQQGHAVETLAQELTQLDESYDAFAAFAERIATAPLREDWPYVEPNDLDAIWAECDPDRPTAPIGTIDLDDAARRAEAAFLGAVCGCILGKPLEVNPTLDEIRTAAQAVGEWPLRDYIPESLLAVLGRRNRQWAEACREQIAYIAPDDDINYSIIGMLLLERFGSAFTKTDIMNIWLENLAPGWTFGPERTTLIKAATHSIYRGGEMPIERWASRWNPRSELCGAAIRVDAYGYACPGDPTLAAELAWRDASCTHRRTGIYGAMFVAAAIASAFTCQDPLAIYETALQFVPRRSRFYSITADCLTMVRDASDWLDGYERIHAKYRQYGHCQIYQETGTLINTTHFASSVGEGICMQVAQGADTDCYGEIIGSILGAYFGPGHLDERWLTPFNDEIHTALAGFHEQSLSRLAKRMGRLSERVASPVDICPESG